VAPPDDHGWGARFELVVDFEINRPEAEPGRYRRPYVVCWAEDAQGRTVRTLLLWVSQGGAGPDQWLPDLRRWYRDDPGMKRVAKKNLIYTLGRPTRAPGKYAVAWDGKDDRGNPLPEGDYTLSLEAAREHGTHQLLRKTLSLRQEPFVEDLPGDVEIRSARLEYRPRPEPRR
jgi:hypothetical protein